VLGAYLLRDWRCSPWLAAASLLREILRQGPPVVSTIVRTAPIALHPTPIIKYFRSRGTDAPARLPERVSAKYFSLPSPTFRFSLSVHPRCIPRAYTRIYLCTSKHVNRRARMHTRHYAPRVKISRGRSARSTDTSLAIDPRPVKTIER